MLCHAWCGLLVNVALAAVAVPVVAQAALQSLNQCAQHLHGIKGAQECLGCLPAQLAAAAQPATWGSLLRWKGGPEHMKALRATSSACDLCGASSNAEAPCPSPTRSDFCTFEAGVLPDSPAGWRPQLSAASQTASPGWSNLAADHALKQSEAGCLLDSGSRPAVSECAVR